MSASHRITHNSVRRLTSVVLALAAMLFVLGGPGAGSAAASPYASVAPEVEVETTAEVGQPLFCRFGTWSGIISSWTFHWLRDGTEVASGEQTYEITSADRGYSISCLVTVSGPEGEGEEESINSVQIGTPHVNPPEDTVLPEVTPTGSSEAGKQLTCSPGKWNGSPTYEYQWVRDRGDPDATAISSATQSTYTVREEDQGHTLSCNVTARNSGGSATESSSNTVEVPVPNVKLKNTEAPKILGEPKVGESLTCSPGKWTGSPTFEYQWLDEGKAISLATTSSYTVIEEDQGRSLECEVTATSGTEKVSQESAPVKVAVNKPVLQEAPKISGTAEVGKQLTCSTGKWSGNPTYGYTWVRDRGTEKAISVGASSTYTVQTEDSGQSLTCEVAATNSAGTTVAVSAAVVIPAKKGGTAPKNEVAPKVSGIAAVGELLSCSTGKWSGTEPITYSYQWLRGSESIGSATQSTYTVQKADQGHSLSCEVTAINEEGKAEVASSNSVSIPAGKVENVEAPKVSVSGEVAVGEQLICSPGTWSGEPTKLSYQWWREGASISSATTSTYTIQSADLAHSLSCKVTASKGAESIEAQSGNSVYVPGSKPVNIEAPSVSGANPPEPGDELTCSPGAWSAEPAVTTIEYQWLLEGTSIPSQTQSTYKVTLPDRGRSIACQVTEKNTEGPGSATSNAVHVPGTPPEDVEAPQIVGSAVVGERLACRPGIWNGKPPPVLTYEWLLDGTIIPSATQSTYTVEPADQGNLLTCIVTATNGEGRSAEAESGGLAIPYATKVETPTLGLLKPAVDKPMQPTLTAAQILAALRAQMPHAQSKSKARIASVLKSDEYAFSFTAPTAGTLKVFWYQVPKGAHVSAKSTKIKPLLVASSTTSFTAATKKTVKLRLTSAGRRLLKSSKSVKLTIKAVFTSTREVSATWLGTFSLGG